MLLIPLLVGVCLIGAGRIVPIPLAHNVAGITALITFGLAIGVAIERPSVDRAWLPELGVRSSFAVDGISIPLVLLTALIGVLVVAHARGEVPDGGSAATFLGCLLLVVGGALATFTARDAILFFLAFELVLIPMWVLITRFGDPHRPPARAEAGWRFVLYTAVGSTLMLVGILLLVASAHSSDLGRLLEVAPSLPRGRQLTIALLLTVGLAVKVPLFPLHTWLPSAHTIAPTAGSVLLAAVLLKMGTYGLVRFPVALVPEGFGIIAPAVAIAAAISILWGGLICLVERDLKRLIAYSSVAHMGYVTVGAFSMTTQGIQGALFQMLSHGVVSAALFLAVGVIYDRVHSREINVYGGLVERMPGYALVFMVFMLASVGLPGTGGFVGEFLVMLGAFRVNAWVGALTATGMILGAAYMLYLYRRVIFGQLTKDKLKGLLDLTPRETAVFAPLLVLVVWMGVYPKPFLDVMHASVGQLVERVEVARANIDASVVAER